jgi:hypothetical protein
MDGPTPPVERQPSGPTQLHAGLPNMGASDFYMDPAYAALEQVRTQHGAESYCMPHMLFAELSS